MTNSKHYSTNVVGAGPAGIACAREAAKSGTVLIIERLPLPRHKSCGGMLNEYSQSFFAEEGIEIPADIVCEPRDIHFRYVGWDQKAFRGTNLHFVNVDRDSFDNWLITLLPENVEIWPETRFVGCKQNPEGITVQVRNANDPHAEVISLTCGYLVGCDGPRSEVRRQTPATKLALYKTLQDFVPITQPLEPYFDCLYTKKLGSEYGYGYVVPKGDVAIVGSVFYPGSKHVKELHEQAVDLFAEHYKFSTDAVAREAWVAVKVNTIDDISAGSGRILLAGEAAGIFSPSSGEGISFALNTGSRAGKAIASARETDTRIGKPYAPGESAALHLYADALEPIRSNVARRLLYFPFLDSHAAKIAGAIAPQALMNYVVHRI